MLRVYQRLALSSWLLATAACGGRAPLAVAEPAADRPAIAAELFLDSREIAGPALGSDGAVYATEISRRGARAIRVELRGGTPSGLVPGVPGESRLAALLADGRRALVELDGDAAAPLALALREADGRLQRLPSLGDGRERFLSDARQGAFLTVVAGPGERVVENGPAPTARRVVYAAPPGFRVAAASPDAHRLALVRSLDERSDEVVWHDRTSGETRLLLPADREGRFDPLLFASGGDTLLVRVEHAGEPAFLAKVDLATSRLSRFGAFRCPPGGARRSGDDETLLVELSCSGRIEAIRVDREGRELPLPSLPEGTRLLDWSERAGTTDAALLAGSARWPPDLLASTGGGLLPLTYGLPPRLPPSALPQVELLDLEGGAAGVRFAELWRARVPARSAWVWIDGAGRRERFDPLLAALASGGARVVRAAGDPAAFAVAPAREFLSDARRRVAGELPPGAPLILVVEGEMSAAVAAAEGTSWSQLIWLWPAMTPSEPESTSATTPAGTAPKAGVPGGERAASAEDPLLALLTRPGASRPDLLLVLDSADPRTPPRVSSLAAAPARGLAVLVVRRSRLSSRLPDDAALALLARALPRAVPQP